MGLKFKDKTSLGSPQPGDVAERELQLDLKDKSIYSSTNGTDLIRISQPEVVGKKWSATGIYQKGDIVTYPKSFVGGFTIDEFYIATTSNNVNNNPTTDIANWQDARIVRYLSENHEITIGGHGAATGDFDSLQTCLQYLGRFIAVDGAALVIKILNGHVIDYLVNTGNLTFSNNLSVISEGDPVVIDVGSPATKNRASLLGSRSTTALLFNGIAFVLVGNNTYPLSSSYSGIFGGIGFSFTDCTLDLKTVTFLNYYIMFIAVESIHNMTVTLGVSKFGYCFHNCAKLNNIKVIGTVPAGSKSLVSVQGVSCSWAAVDFGALTTPATAGCKLFYVYQNADAKIRESSLTWGTAGPRLLVEVVCAEGSIIRIIRPKAAINLIEAGFSQVKNVIAASGLIVA